MKEHKNSAANSNSDLKVRVVGSPKQRQWFDQQLDLSHDLGSSPSIGDFLRQIVELNGKPVALLAWGPACYALKDRDLWISWSAPHRIQRLKLIVQNRRLLLLPPKGSSPNLASMAKGAALRALPSQWFDSFGYRPVLAESFTQEQRKKVGLPLKKGTQAFRIVPGYLVFYRLLSIIDPKALYDQTAGTDRCEQSAANALIESMPSLDNQLITADALHSQRKLARIIVETGGEYLLQIKGNQPNLEKRA